ncbi:MAG TPA: glycine zipper 2TM domain-containing protein [Ramlibacter sp.]|nr:glycine zipper 2TM domain-containing protein [Ramlibacter sp.]
MRSTRLASVATGSALAALLAACGSVPLSGPVSSYPSTYPSAPATLEYGRVTNIEFFQGGTTARGVNVPGAIIGAVAGAVIGNVAGRSVGGSSTRDTAAVLGGVAGAAIGSQAGQGGTTTTSPVYRVSIQTDQGVMRTYDVPATGDLRIGDRVRVENGVIYRS